MRTRLAALFAGLAALILAFGAIGSAAWFTGQDTIPVTGTTGKIVFQTNGPNTAGITLSNLLPGAWTPQYYVEVYNTSESTTAVKYRITDAFKSESVAGLFDKVNVRVRHTFCGTGTPGAWPVVYTGPIGDLAVNSVDNAISDSSTSTSATVLVRLPADRPLASLPNKTTTFVLVFDRPSGEPGGSE